MKTFKRFVGLFFGLVLVGAIIAAVVVNTGAYNVAASAPHSAIVRRALDYAMMRSVKFHARGVVLPDGIHLHDPLLAEKSVTDFNEMCVTCHGAPGKEPDPWTKGLHPRAPALTGADVATKWTDVELYWILKNGIKDTGMMAFGSSHDDKELWGLAAIVRQLPTITADQFRTMIERAKAKEESSHQEHSAAATAAEQSHQH